LLFRDKHLLVAAMVAGFGVVAGSGGVPASPQGENQFLS
jgi:hypothetical protein